MRDKFYQLEDFLMKEIPKEGFLCLCDRYGVPCLFGFQQGIVELQVLFLFSFKRSDESIRDDIGVLYSAGFRWKRPGQVLVVNPSQLEEWEGLYTLVVDAPLSNIYHITRINIEREAQ